MKFIIAADMPLEWRRLRRHVRPNHPVCCGSPMWVDTYFGVEFVDGQWRHRRYYCIDCGADTMPLVLPEPSDLEAHWDRVPTGWIVEAGAKDAAHNWRAVGEADAAAYEAENPLRDRKSK